VVTISQLFVKFIFSLPISKWLFTSATYVGLKHAPVNRFWGADPHLLGSCAHLELAQELIQVRFVCSPLLICNLFLFETSSYRNTISKCYKHGDKLRDCRKSPNLAILPISHVMKSNSYEHQNHKLRVFRQSLQLSVSKTWELNWWYHRFHANP